MVGSIHLAHDPRITALCFGLAAAVLHGCSSPGRVFDAIDPPVVWPPAPATARIRFVGQLRSSADLKPGRGFFQSVKEIVTGAAAPQPLFGPRDVLCTGDGRRVWVADPGGRCLHMFNLDDRTYARLAQLGTAGLRSPVGLCRGPADTLFVCDSEAVAIHQFTAETGEWIKTIALPSSVQRPVAATWDEPSARLWVVDVGAHDVKALDVDGRLLAVVGGRGLDPGRFNFPTDIHFDGEWLWIVDTGNNRVQALTTEGGVMASVGAAGNAPGDFAMPKSIAFDNDGHLYVVDARFENVQIFDRAGRLLLFFGHEGQRPGEFWLPAGIFIDERDRIWICDTYNRRVQVFDYVSGRKQ